MRTKHIILSLLCLGFSAMAEAQFLNNLKKKVEDAATRTLLRKTEEVVSQKTEEIIDDATTANRDKSDGANPKSDKTRIAPSGTTFENPALANNTKAKRAWYTSDVRVTSYDHEKQSDMIIYFDADAIAMRSDYTDKNTGEPVTSYIDSDGFFISYDKSEQQFTKTALLSMPGMNMMAPSMMASAYKLPESAIFEAFEEMTNQELAIYPFMHVDFPFVLKPEHFREEMNTNIYKESKQSCRGSMGCTKFSVQESGYEGSYTLFDDQGRLVEINVEAKDDPFYGTGKGKIKYFYEDNEVRLPKAEEKKMLGQDILNKGMQNIYKQD